MIIVRVELHSAVTGKVTELARMMIANVGGSSSHGNYQAVTYRGRDGASLDQRIVTRRGGVTNYPRLAIHVWHLVARALIAMNYAGKAEQRAQSDMEVHL